jgi:hypothetical protein
MATYTTEDLDNSSKFAEYNLYVRYINALHQKAPHIISYLDYNITDATDDDFYIPSSLTGQCKMIDIKITEYLCNVKLNCNPIKEKDTCKSSDLASNYLIGTEAYGVQCQPSCFNLSIKKNYSDSTETPSMPMLNWYKDNCRYVPSGVASYLEKPFYRSKTIYEYRVNNFPTGFPKVTPDDQLFRKYDSGYSYRSDSAYCSYFNRLYDSENDNCEMAPWEEFVDSVLGMNIINLANDSVNYLKSGGASIFDTPSHIPVPDIEPIYTLDGWKKDVNADFILPSEMNYNSQTNVTLKGRMYSSPIKLTVFSSANEQQTKHDARRFLERKIKLENKHLAPQQRRRQKPKFRPSNFIGPMLKQIRKVVPDESALYQLEKNLNLIDSVAETYDSDNSNFFNDLMDAIKEGGDILIKTIKSILEAILTDPETQKQLGIGIAFDKALSWVKTLSTKLLTRLSESLITLLAKEGVDMGINVLEKSIFSTFMSICVSFAAKIASKLAIMLLNALISTVDVIGWILEVGMMLNLVAALWDPFGMNKMFPAGYADEVMRQGEQAYKVQAGINELNYTFTSLVGSLLTDDEILAIQMQSLIDRAIYLDALEVNSEGSRIDKGDTIDYSHAINSNTENQTLAKSIVPIYKFDYDSYSLYNESFLTRVETNQKLALISTFAFFVPIILLGLGFKLLAMIVLVILVLIICWFKYGIYSQSDDFILTLSNFI